EFATPRMSELAPAADGIEDEDLIEREDMVVTVTVAGYIKRTPLSVFREQKRGGKGRAGMATKEEDAVTTLFVTSTHNPVLFFSNLGRVFQSRTSTGVRGVRLQPSDEVISMSILHRVGTTQEEREAYLRFAPWKGEKEGECPLPQDRIAELAEKEQFILTVTENGYGKRSSAYEYRRTNRGGQGITN